MLTPTMACIIIMLLYVLITMILPRRKQEQQEDKDNNLDHLAAIPGAMLLIMAFIATIVNQMYYVAAWIGVLCVITIIFIIHQAKSNKE